jgi:hypothetical protein
VGARGARAGVGSGRVACGREPGPRGVRGRASRASGTLRSAPVADLGTLGAPVADSGTLGAPVADSGTLGAPVADSGTLGAPVADPGDFSVRGERKPQPSEGGGPAPGMSHAAGAHP